MIDNIKLYCICNSKYKEVAANWALHLENKAIPNYQVICIDKESFTFLKNNNLNAFFYEVAETEISSQKFRQPQAGVVYNGFKLKILNFLLKQGRPFIFSDADAVAVEDPRSFVSPYLQKGFCVVSKGLQKGNFYDKFGFAICSGWMAFGKGRMTKWLTKEIDAFLSNQSSQTKISCDQQYFNELILTKKIKIKKSTKEYIHLHDGYLNIIAASNSLISRGRKKNSSLVVHPWSSNVEETINRLKLDNAWIF